MRTRLGKQLSEGFVRQGVVHRLGSFPGGYPDYLDTDPGIIGVTWMYCMRPILVALALACSGAAAPAYRFLLVAGSQWEDSAGFLIGRPSEFQVTAALLKSWGLPFDVLRQDQQPPDRYHLLGRDGN